MTLSKIITAVVAAFGALTLIVGVAEARAPEIYLKKGGAFSGKAWEYAINGHDAVAYFDIEEGADPVEGSTEFQTEYKGATWLFSSAENLSKFEENPDQYAPQYGGYCAWALAVRSKLVEGAPNVWKIHDGKLYLNVNRGTQRRWFKDIPGFVETADAKWPAILDEN